MLLLALKEANYSGQYMFESDFLRLSVLLISTLAHGMYGDILDCPN